MVEVEPFGEPPQARADVALLRLGITHEVVGNEAQLVAVMRQRVRNGEGIEQYPQAGQPVGADVGAQVWVLGGPVVDSRSYLVHCPRIPGARMQEILHSAGLSPDRKTPSNAESPRPRTWRAGEPERPSGPQGRITGSFALLPV